MSGIREEAIVVHLDRTPEGWKMESKDPQEMAIIQHILEGVPPDPEIFRKEKDVFVGTLGKVTLPRELFPWDSIDLKRRGD